MIFLQGRFIAVPPCFISLAANLIRFVTEVTRTCSSQSAPEWDLFQRFKIVYRSDTVLSNRESLTKRAK